jgi:hypothetical protein
VSPTSIKGQYKVSCVMSLWLFKAICL